MTGTGLPIVDGLRLPEEYRRVLKPDALLADEQGRARRLPLHPSRRNPCEPYPFSV